MKLKINQQDQEFETSLNLGQIIDHLNLKSTQGIALAVNHEVIHRNSWQSYQPSEGDSIILMQAAQGG